MHPLTLLLPWLPVPSHRYTVDAAAANSAKLLMHPLTVLQSKHLGLLLMLLLCTWLLVRLLTLLLLLPGSTVQSLLCVH